MNKRVRFISNTFGYEKDITVSLRLLTMFLLVIIVIESLAPALILAKQTPPQSTPVTTLTFHLTDHLGSVTVSTDDKGNVVELNDYYPYGSIRVDEKSNNGSSKEQRKYIGQEYDVTSGLSYLNARYYDGGRGQFLSQDPAVIDVDPTLLQDPQQLNSYSYARNNPFAYRDANGEKVEIVSRPVSVERSAVATKYGAHTFLKITPENPKTIGKIIDGKGNNIGIDTNQTFTLGGTTFDEKALIKQANGDYNYIKGCDQCTSALVKPPMGLSAEAFESGLVDYYNSLPDKLSDRYDGFGYDNSNNVTTSLLVSTGIPNGRIDVYQTKLFFSNYRIAPGLGQSISGYPSLSSIGATLLGLSRELSRFNATLQNYLSSDKKK